MSEKRPGREHLLMFGQEGNFLQQTLPLGGFGSSTKKITFSPLSTLRRGDYTNPISLLSPSCG